MGKIDAVVFAALLLATICHVEAGLGRTFWKTREKLLKKYHENHNHGELLAKIGNVTTDFILQPLDHFDLEDTKEPVYFPQRYFMNDEHWKKPDGPVFLYIGGEGELSEYAIMEGHTVDMAQQFGALLFGVEHRFYGKSLNKEGLKLDQLQYLNSQQALADLASFHGFAVKKYGLTSKNTWICFGGSYPGALSAWFRLKYPHLVHAAVASSAPVRAQVNFEGYNEVVAASFGNPMVGGSKQCTANIRSAFQAVSAKSSETLRKDFNTCTEIATDNDMKTFISNVAGPFQGAAQYNRVLEGMNAIGMVCKNMTKNTDSYRNLVDLLKVETEKRCFDISYDEFIKTLQDTEATGGIGMRQWYYQTCQQFGYYQTCDKNTSCMFLPKMDITYDLGMCKDVYGFNQTQIYKKIDFTNLYYGADRPDGARVIFVNGDIDPWHALSITESLSKDEVAVFIKGASHCQDMGASDKSDSPELIKGREMIEQQLKTWLSS